MTSQLRSASLLQRCALFPARHCSSTLLTERLTVQHLTPKSGTKDGVCVEWVVAYADEGLVALRIFVFARFHAFPLES